MWDWGELVFELFFFSLTHLLLVGWDLETEDERWVVSNESQMVPWVWCGFLRDIRAHVEKTVGGWFSIVRNFRWLLSGVAQWLGLRARDQSPEVLGFTGGFLCGFFFVGFSGKDSNR